MKIVSWNVNGIRAVIKKGFMERLQTNKPDILCLQETKAFREQLPKDVELLLQQRGYKILRHNGTRPGYAGTAILYRQHKDAEKSEYTENAKNIDNINKRQRTESKIFLKNKFDGILNTDGRITEVGFGNTVVINVYFPNGGIRADGTEMLSFKLEFYDEIMKYCDKIVKNGKNIIITGDFNICHRTIDIARPKANKNSIGFLPIEREKIGSFFDRGYIDLFRKFYPDLSDQYTWWSYRAGARNRNVGRRLDYFVVNQKFTNNIISINHLTDIKGSDHCPIEIVINVKKKK